MRLILLDTETNGLDPFIHNVIEIAIKIVDAVTGDVIDEYESKVRLTEDEWGKSQKSSLHINGFKFEMIKDAPSLDEVRNSIMEFFKKNSLKRGKSVFLCQNPSFDRVFFSKVIPTSEQELRMYPYHWLDLASMFWALSLKKNKLPWDVGLSKNKIATHLNIEEEGIPHKAMNGVNHLLSCYESLIGFAENRIKEAL